MMRTLATLALVALLALPAAAAECSELEITQRDAGGPLVTGHTPGTNVWTSIVGTFLWVHYEKPEAGSEGDTAVTVDIGEPDIVGATVCPDGTVTLHRAAAPKITETPEPEVVDLAEEFSDFERFIDTLRQPRGSLVK